MFYRVLPCLLLADTTLSSSGNTRACDYRADPSQIHHIIKADVQYAMLWENPEESGLKSSLNWGNYNINHNPLNWSGIKYKFSVYIVNAE